MSMIDYVNIPSFPPSLSDGPVPRSFQDAIELTPSLPGLSDTQRRDYRSALTMVAKWSGQPASDLPLTPAFLRKHFLSASPAAFGVTSARKTNIKTGVSTVMKSLGLVDKTDWVLSSPWTNLLAKLTRHKRITMGSFARFCDSGGVTPDKVVPETFAEFQAHLFDRTLTPRPKKLAGEVRALWNKSVRSVPGWPSTLLTKPVNPTDYVLPATAFQQAFQAVVGAFGKRLGGSSLSDPFADDPLAGSDDEAPMPSFKPLRASTVVCRMGHVRWAASALVAAGYPIEEITSLSCLVTPIGNARTILKYLHDRAGAKPSAAGHHVADVLRIIARYEVHASAADLTRLEAWSALVRLRYHGMTEKNERTVREALEPEREARLLLLPASLMATARKLRGTSPKIAAGLALRGLSIEILTKLPLRLENLTHLRLDQHLHRPDPRRGLVTHINIPAGEVKNDRALSMPVVSATAALMTEWISDFRPTIAMAGSPFLFPGARTVTKPITPQGMRDAVKAVTNDHVGVTITPHQFRHIAARQFLRQFPGQYETVRQFLGHKDVATTVKSYSGIEHESSIRRLDEVLTARLKLHSKARRDLAKGR